MHRWLLIHIVRNGKIFVPCLSPIFNFFISLLLLQSLKAYLVLLQGLYFYVSLDGDGVEVNASLNIPGFLCLCWDAKVLCLIKKYVFNEDKIFVSQISKERRLIFFSHTVNDFANRISILNHFLVMAAALVWVACYNHIRHHLVDPDHFFLILV